MSDDDLARELVNIAYHPRLADRAALEATAKAVVDVGGCDRVSLLAWALLSACARARAKARIPISTSWRPAPLRRRAR
jgi:hypothetical protein